jgi:hypothetical protein
MIHGIYLRELSEQVRGESPTAESLFNLGANVAPIVGPVMSTGLEAANLVDFRGSWIALVGRTTDASHGEDAS